MVPAHVFTNGAEKTADELHNFMLPKVKIKLSREWNLLFLVR
jgi:hypothetical protein